MSMSQQKKGFAYGMSAEVQRKIDSKRDQAKEAEIQAWIEAITGDKFDSEQTFEQNLHGGVRLCKLANTIKPRAFKYTPEPKMPFKQMENVEKFLKFCEDQGVPKTDLFPVASLHQFSNIPQVTGTIIALGRVCHLNPDFDPNSPSYKGWPNLGPKPAHENVREFDEKTIAEGKKIIGIQAGTNKLASQAGGTFGGRRQIDIHEGPRT